MPLVHLRSHQHVGTDTATIPAFTCGPIEHAYYSVPGSTRTPVVGTTTPASAHYTYSYDLAGNRTDGGRQYNAANQMDDWAYDAAGNLTNDGTRTYTYDALNRLTQQRATSYSYNGDCTLLQAGTTRYTQDLLAPLSKVLNDGSADYVYGLDRLAAQTGVSRTWYTADALGHGKCAQRGAVRPVGQLRE